MGKLKMFLVMVVVFFLGVGVGSAGKSSSTTSTDIKQSSATTQDQTTASLVPEATPAGKVEVKSHKKKLDMGYTKVVGEVVNNTGVNAESVKVTATFYDKDEQVIGTGFTFAGDTTSTPLAAGLTTPFEVSSYPDEITVDHYKLDVTWR